MIVWDLVKKVGEGSGKGFDGILSLQLWTFSKWKIKVSKQGHNTTQKVRTQHNSMRFTEHPHWSWFTNPAYRILWSSLWWKDNPLYSLKVCNQPWYKELGNETFQGLIALSQLKRFICHDWDSFSYRKKKSQTFLQFWLRGRKSEKCQNEAFTTGGFFSEKSIQILGWSLHRPSIQSQFNWEPKENTSPSGTDCCSKLWPDDSLHPHPPKPEWL